MFMAVKTQASRGLFATLKELGNGLLATVKDRVELVSIEFQEEKMRLIQTFIWISAAVFTAIMAITFASLTVVYLFWERSRLEVLAGLAILYIVACTIILVRFRSYLARQPRPFSATIEEIGEDQQLCIRSEN